MIDIRQPNITAATDREQLIQMRSYLYQLSQQLNWAFSTIETGGQSSAGTTYRPAQSKQQTGDADPATTFANIKGLIIKSADIVNAYYDQINTRLTGVYVAQSDFGTYAEQTNLDIQGNSQNIDQLFTNSQTIITRVDALSSENESLSGRVDEIASDAAAASGKVDEMYAQSILTNAYLRTGLLYYAENGSPVYGLEIGQTNSIGGETVFDKFARFTADRLSFFDSNDVEVAYISDYKLYITNAEITGSLWLSGKFKVYYNNGLAFQWIGGSA